MNDLDEQATSKKLFDEGMVWFEKDNFSIALPYLEKSASLNYPPSLVILFLHYNSYATNLEQANHYSELCKHHKQWFTEHSLTGDAIAQYCYGVYLQHIENDDKFVVWIRKASEQGYARAQCTYATILDTDINEALVWYQRAADQGYAKAEFKIARCFLKGTGVNTDTKQAFLWTKKAAEHGNAMAECVLGYFYENGTGVEQNHKKAVEVYTSAANRGNAKACVLLGVCYEKGKGVPKNSEQTLYWYHRAVELKSHHAEYLLGQHYITNKTTTLGLYWISSAASKEFPRAQCALGDLYFNGLDVLKQDFKKAAYWYQTTADAGFTEGHTSLGICHEYGYGVPRDCERAVQLYQIAADQGSSNAQCNLGACLGSGKGVKQDLEQAACWYQKAAKQGHTRAQYCLALCLQYGTGVTQDLKEAIEWLEKAAIKQNLRHIQELKKLKHVLQVDKGHKEET